MILYKALHIFIKGSAVNSNPINRNINRKMVIQQYGSIINEIQTLTHNTDDGRQAIGEQLRYVQMSRQSMQKQQGL